MFKIVKQVGGPSVVSVSVKTSGKHIFGVAAVRDGKMSKPTTHELEITI